jgi:DNA-binding MarR family transcriptional regulator
MWICSMKEKSQSEAKRRVGSAEESAFLELLRTTDMLSRRFAQLLKAEELSSTQYNVLRILRGAPEGLPCGEIGNRMITRDPDITRLLDRLEKRGLASRCRETKDRRMVLTRITDEGLALLARLDEPVQEIHHEQLGHLGRERLQALVELARAARSKAG